MTTDLLQQFADLSPEERSLVLEELRAQGIDIPLDTPSGPEDNTSLPPAEDHHSASIPPRDHTQPIPLSFQQEQLWFLHQLEPGSVAYNERDILLLEGDLDIDALQQAVHAVVRCHDSLRTIFVADRPEQGEHEQALDVVNGAESSDELNRARQVIQPFDAAVHTLTHQTISTFGHNPQCHRRWCNHRPDHLGRDASIGPSNQRIYLSTI